MHRGRLIALQVGVMAVTLLLWHVLTTIPVGGKPLLPPFFFSTPIDVAERVVKWFAEGTIWRHLWITLTEAALAFIVGSVLGVAVGFWFARQPLVAAVFDPYVKMINALPRIVLAPIFTLWFGLGIMSYDVWPCSVTATPSKPRWTPASSSSMNQRYESNILSGSTSWA